MSDDENKKSDIQQEELSREQLELSMYKDYLNNMNAEDLCVKYAMSIDNVYRIAKKNDWKNKRLKIKQQAYKNLDKKYQQQIVDIINFIEKDYIMLMEKCKKEKREMTAPERSYVLSLMEKLTKESRLNEGKPTEINNGNQVVEHRVLLPPGVSRFGVIPPAANVKQLTSVPEEKSSVQDESTEDNEDL